MRKESKAFISSYDGLANVLMNEAAVCQPNEGQAKCMPVKALWDTGASGSVISERVVQELGLVPTGMTEVSGVGGKHQTETYVINLILANKVGFRYLTVTKGKGFEHFDVLVGMDVISQGDFAVTNFKGKTAFTFVYPSQKKIDFVQEYIRDMDMLKQKVTKQERRAKRKAEKDAKKKSRGK